MRSIRTLAFAFLAIAILAQGALAQELRGRIAGVVTDDSGAVVPGVTVTATSPALIQAQITITGADGSYRFPALPSGLYTITYQLQGFQTVRREGLRVTLNQTFTIDARMKPASLTETMTITAESPAVDTKTTSIGTAFTKELLTDIPNARDVWAAMAQAPGFQMTGYDVGGSHTGTQTGYMTYGVGDQNKTMIEGINVTESTAANAGYFDFGSFEEFQLGGAGNMGEQSGPGALMNITVKSGGDKFGGQIYFDFENDQTIGDNVPSAFKAPGGVGDGGFKAPSLVNPANRTGPRLGLQTGNAITKQYDFNVGFGGPVIKGKLWFFLGYRDNNQYKTILGLPGEEAQSQLKNKTVKVTYQVSQRNQLIAFWNERSKLQPLRDLSLATPVEAAYYQASVNRPMKLEWTSVLSDALFLDLQGSYWTNFFPLFPTKTGSADTTGVGPGRLNVDTSQLTGANNGYQDQKRYKPQFSGSLAYFKGGWKGNHSFKLGVEVQRDRKQFLSFQPGNIFYRDRNSLTTPGVAGTDRIAEVDIWNTPNESVNDAVGIGVYLQDSWSMNSRFSLNYGARFDQYDLTWPEQNFDPERKDFFTPRVVPAADVVSLKSISPRIGFAWDVTGKGKTVVKAFFGRYAYNPSADVADRENPVGRAQQRYAFVPCAAGQTTGCDVNNNKVMDSRSELGALLSTQGGAGFVTVDRGIKSPYGLEFSTHLEQELLPGFSARGSYVFKGTRREWAEVDLNRVAAFTVPFNFADNGPDGLAATAADNKTLSLLSRPATAEKRTYVNPEQYGLPEYKGNYHTAEVALNRRMKGKWMLLTSFEHTWAKDFRDTASSTSSLGVARQGTVYLWAPNRRRFGAQSTSFWNYKLLGRYEFPLGLSVAASYKVQSGFNWARTVVVTLPGGQGTETIHAEPLSANRSPNVQILDFRAEKAFRFGSRKITGMVDVFNALNADTVANFRITSGAQFQELIALLDPRIVRFGVRLDF